MSTAAYCIGHITGCTVPDPINPVPYIIAAVILTVLACIGIRATNR